MADRETSSPPRRSPGRDGIRLSRDDLETFAVASLDRNPLHLDDDFAHHSPYGKPIAHGALVVITALGTLPRTVLDRTTSLKAAFHQPIYPDSVYHVTTADDPAGGPRLRVTCHGTLTTSVELTTGPETFPERDAPGEPESVPEQAPVWSAAQLRDRRWAEHFRPDLARLRALADRLGAGSVPDTLLDWLAWSSWAVGMRAPGRDALFGRLTLTRHPAAKPLGHSELRVDTIDDRTGAIALSGTYAGARADLRAFLRSPVPAPTAASLAHHLAPSDRLRGHRVLLIGGSRGFGASLAAALASQSATVWVTFRASATRVTELAREFGPDRIRPLQCDATDIEQLRTTLRPLHDEGALDGLALLATPPLRAIDLHHTAVPSQLEFIHTSLALALNPLAVAGPLLNTRDSWLMAASSTAVSHTPPGWSHYAATKTALETITTDFATRNNIRALIMRAPKMRTHLVDGPTAQLDATPPEKVAATVTNWVLDKPKTTVTTLT